MLYTVLLFFLFIIAVVATHKIITYVIQDNNDYRKRSNRRL